MNAGLSMEILSLIFIMIYVILFIWTRIVSRKYTKRIHHEKKIIDKEAKEVAIKLGKISLLGGLSYSLFFIIFYQSSRTSVSQIIPFYWGIIFVVDFTIIYSIFLILLFYIQLFYLKIHFQDRPRG